MLQRRLTEPHTARCDQVREEILKLILADGFVGNKLPAESKLALRFGVGINVVREALVMLREDGIVTKKHGSGNYVHKSALKITGRIDRNPDFYNLLRLQGYAVRQTPFTYSIKAPPEWVRAALGLAPGEDVLFYEDVFFADGDAAILCEAWFPVKHFREFPPVTGETINFFDIMIRYFKHEIAYGSIEYVPSLAGEAEHAAFGLPVGAPYTVMEEIFFSLEDTPLVFSRNRYNAKYIRANVVCT